MAKIKQKQKPHVKQKLKSLVKGTTGWKLWKKNDMFIYLLLFLCVHFRGFIKTENMFSFNSTRMDELDDAGMRKKKTSQLSA